MRGNADRARNRRLVPTGCRAGNAHAWPFYYGDNAGRFLPDEIHARTLACLPSYAWTEPAGEPHSNHIESGGARALILEVDHTYVVRMNDVQPRLLDDITLQYDPYLAAEARRALAEVRQQDELSATAIESMVLMMLVRAARLGRILRGRGTPSWLNRVRDYLHDHFRDHVPLSILASVAGTSPAVVSQHFRRAFGSTPGEYVRALRTDWALAQLIATRESISTIAQRAGFSDQSHLTRACTGRVGMSPAVYRRAAGR